MKNQDIMRLFGITESFQLFNKLNNILFDADKRTALFEDFLKLESDSSYEWFTDYFQIEQAARKSLKQDYTPVCVSKLASGLLPTEQSGAVLDCCAGIGGLTIAAWNRNKDSEFIAEELSENSVMLLLFNLAIRGIKGVVKHCDVLSGEIKHIYKLTPQGRFSDIEEVDRLPETSAGAVISNPPYSLKWDKADDFKDDERFKEYGLPPKAKADFAFVLHGLHKLKSGGTAVYILPHGVLFRGQREGAIRRKIVENNLLDAVIGLPEGLFLNTRIPVCLLIFKKDRENKDILFIDASRDFEKLKNQNALTDEHINKILTAYRERWAIEKYSRNVTLKEIEENDFNLNIQRYVDTSEPKPKVDINAVNKELFEIESEIQKTTGEISKMLRDLNGSPSYTEQKNIFINFAENKDYHAYSEMVNEIDRFTKSAEAMLTRRKTVNLYDVADFERSKKNKEYPAGSILIQVSATRGQMVFMKEAGKVDDRYGVIMPKGIEPKYLYFVLDMVMPSFLSRYQTGLNINPKIFKHLKFEVHRDGWAQKIVVDILNSLQECVNCAQRELAAHKEFKQYHLDEMFP